MNELEIEAGLAPTPGYRYADVVGDRLFLAGQVPHGQDGELIGADDPAQQARVCLDNLTKLLATRGFGLDSVRRLVVYVVGAQPVLAEAWSGVRDWFGGEVPPATLLGVASLGHVGQIVEVDAEVMRG